MTAALRTANMSSSPLGKESDESDNESGENKASTDDKADKPDILNPGPHDVLLGRGGGTNNHIGNKNFRELVTCHKMKYLACSKVEKPNVAREVVGIWRKLDPPGRFLQRKDETKKGPGSIRDEDVVWTEVDDQEARKKASQCLRERTPDVQSIIKSMQQHEDQPTEGRISSVPVNVGKAGRHRGPAGVIASGARSNQQIVAADTAQRFGMPDRPMSVNQNSIKRRGSLPATVHSAHASFIPGLSTHVATSMRPQDRRVSLPPSNQLQGNQVLRNFGTDFNARQQQALRNAYTVIEQPSSLDPMDVQLQQNLISNRQVMMPQHFMEVRLKMIQRGNEQMMSRVGGPVIGMGMSPQQHDGGAALAQMMSGQAQILLHQQRSLVQQHEELLAEQERLVRQEHMIARRELEIAQQEQLVRQLQGQLVDPSATFSGQIIPNMNFGQELFVSSSANDLEPIPISEEEDYSMPLLADPDSQPSAISAARNHANNVESILQDETKSEVILDQNEAACGSASSGLTLDPSQCDQNDKTDPKAMHSEYRRTVESYIFNNQNSLHSMDLNGGLPEEEAETLDGVASSDWIEEQLMNNSGDFSMSTKERPKPPCRSSSKKSSMSVASSADEMSFAFSEMDHFEELSKRENKRCATRSMSILSTNTNMSELTDFDELDCL